MGGTKEMAIACHPSRPLSPSMAPGTLLLSTRIIFVDSPNFPLLKLKLHEIEWFLCHRNRHTARINSYFLTAYPKASQ